MTFVKGMKAGKQGGREGGRQAGTAAPLSSFFGAQSRSTPSARLAVTPFASRCSLTNIPGYSAKNDKVLISELGGTPTTPCSYQLGKLGLRYVKCLAQGHTEING